MSQWTSKYAMLKDLSVAQGRRVPASLEPSFGDKPPTINCVEETEEEFYKDYVGDGDFNVGPDIGLIQEMLSLVRERRLSSDDEADKLIVVSKLNPNTTEFVPKHVVKDSKRLTTKKPKKKRHNVAVSSLLDALESAENEPPVETVKEAKVSPVQEALPTMFRRKKYDNSLNGSPKAATSPTGSNNAATSPITSNNCTTYKPSTLANEYYTKFVEKNRLKEFVQEDIWTRAERKMKEIDEKKKLETLVPSSTNSQPSVDGAATGEDNSSIACGIEYVTLPQPRHAQTDECVVCEVFKKHGHDIKIEL